MCKVCVCMYQILASFSCYAKECVNIMKVYIKRNNMQVELIRFRKNIDFIHVYVCELYVYSIFARWQHASPHSSKSQYFASVKRQYMYACCLHVLTWND